MKTWMLKTAIILFTITIYSTLAIGQDNPSPTDETKTEPVKNVQDQPVKSEEPKPEEVKPEEPVTEPPKPEEVKPETTNAYDKYSGTWKSNAGPVDLKIMDNAILGAWNEGKGTIRGTIDGAKIVYTWTEVGESGEIAGKGWFVVVSDKRIEGEWGTGNSDNDGGTWILSRD